MQDSIIYDVVKKMNDRNIAKNDMNEATMLISNFFREKYIQQIEDEFNSKKEYLINKPPKEVMLMNCLKEFLPSAKHNDLDNMISIVNNFSAINSLMGENKNNIKNSINKNPKYSVNNVNNLDKSIHKDGVYDFDENCHSTKNVNLNFDIFQIIIIALLLFNKSKN